MQKHTRRTVLKMVAAALLLLAAGAAAADAPGAAVVVTDAWVSEAPPTARNLAAFLSLTNGPRGDTLLSATTPIAEVAEFHEMSRANGLMRMRQLTRIPLAPRETLVFGPGARHIMLINVKQPLKAGDKVPLTLKFRRSGPITVQAEVRPLAPDEAASQTDHSAHHH